MEYNSVEFLLGIVFGAGGMVCAICLLKLWWMNLKWSIIQEIESDYKLERNVTEDKK